MDDQDFAGSGVVLPSGRGGVEMPGAAPRVTSGIVEHHDWRVALSRLVDEVIPADIGTPDLVMLFASTSFAPSYPELVAAARYLTGARQLVGSSGSGVIGGGVELERRPGLAMMAWWLPDAELTVTYLDKAEVDALAPAGNDLPLTTSARSWLVLGEPFRCNVQGLLNHLAQTSPGVPVVGGLSARSGDRRQGWIFHDDRVVDEGALAISLGGPYRLLPVVAQGCEPIGEVWTITEVERNVLRTIGCRPALERLDEAIATLPVSLQAHAWENVVLGFAMDEYQETFHRGDFLVRGVLAIDRDRGWVRIGGRPRVGQSIQVHIRDAEVAGIALKQVLTDARATLGEARPLAGMLFSGKGRGEGLFGAPHHDAAFLQASFPGLPVVGMTAGMGVAPAARRVALHGFAAVIALLVADAFPVLHV